jgi:hypothetical protein
MDIADIANLGSLDKFFDAALEKANKPLLMDFTYRIIAHEDTEVQLEFCGEDGEENL